MTTFSLASFVHARVSDDSHALLIAEKCALFDFASSRAQILCSFSTLCTMMMPMPTSSSRRVRESQTAAPLCKLT